MRTQREDFFPSELYWLDRVGPVGMLEQRHGGIDTDVVPLLAFGGKPSLLVMFDRLIEPDWEQALQHVKSRDLTILDARVTLTWPTAAGTATWKGHDAPYMILNLYELLMRLALAGAGRALLHDRALAAGRAAARHGGADGAVRGGFAGTRAVREPLSRAVG